MDGYIHTYSQLHIAALKGQIELSKLFLSHGMSPDIQNNYGNTPLHLAIRNRLIEVSKVLLSHGASRNIKNNDGNTPVKLSWLSKFQN